MDLLVPINYLWIVTVNTSLFSHSDFPYFLLWRWWVLGGCQGDEFEIGKGLIGDDVVIENHVGNSVVFYQLELYYSNYLIKLECCYKYVQVLCRKNVTFLTKIHIFDLNNCSFLSWIHTNSTFVLINITHFLKHVILPIVWNWGKIWRNMSWGWITLRKLFIL